jgi:hypothetical protein
LETTHDDRSRGWLYVLWDVRLFRDQQSLDSVLNRFRYFVRTVTVGHETNIQVVQIMNCGGVRNLQDSTGRVSGLPVELSGRETLDVHRG